MKLKFLFSTLTRYCLIGFIVLVAGGVGLNFASLALAQESEDQCVASILNRTVRVNPDGSFAIPNVPVEPGLFRVRVICQQPDGTVVGGMSEFFPLLPAEVPAEIGQITFGAVEPIPVSLQVTAPQTTFHTKGETARLRAVATLPDGSAKEVTSEQAGTLWMSSGSDIASVGKDGLVTVHKRGEALIQAKYEGVLASILLTVLIPNDADGDGMSDPYEQANHLNPNDPTDAGQDLDVDGLTNLQEFEQGTNPRVADTDGDRLADGEEVGRGTDPRQADTDRDGLTDGEELVRGLNPVLADTDGDTLPDGLEVELGLRPLVVDPVTAVQGRVVDAAGAPVADASAVVFNLFIGTTDPIGFFSITGVPAGLGLIEVEARMVRAGEVLDGASPSTAPVSGGITDVGTIPIGLNSGTVAGLVTDPQNRPVSGAVVTVASGSDLRRALADPTGRYQVRGLVAGEIVVTAFDPRTSLRGRSTGILIQNQAVTVDLRLGPSGTVTGTMFGRDGVTPVGAGIPVTLSGSAFLTAATDSFGRYLFDFVPLGTVTVETTDTNGNRARTTGHLLRSGQTVVADLTFLGRGRIAGIVQEASGRPVPNASVQLDSRGLFGGSRSATTDGAGRFAFADVFVGPFTLTSRAPIGQLGGTASGTMERDGQEVTVNITLTATGTLAGTVVRADGTTPVSGAAVHLSFTGLVATTDNQGRYRFDLLPLGFYSLRVTDHATGDRGFGYGQLSRPDEVSAVNIRLNGLGRVVVTVLDGASRPVGGVRVTLTSQTIFGGDQVGATQTDGTLTFERILAGGFSVGAVDPRTQLGGSVTGQVGVGATANVTVPLQAVGSVVGQVVRADGVTPVTNLPVRLAGPVTRQTTSTSNGTFRFDLVPLGTYRLEAFDSVGNRRASSDNVVLSRHGEELVTTLTLIGVGTVEGTITNPDGSVAPGMGASLVSQAPWFIQPFFVQSDIAGRYRIPDVPVGPFAVSASRRVGQVQFFGEARGRVESDNQTVSVDIRLSDGLVPVTTTLYDANNFAYPLRENGSIQDGTAQVFAGDSGANRGGSLLDVVVDGAPSRFLGNAFGTTEEAGREIVIRRENLRDLEVVRKAFVPTQGYFARYLELLRNPTANPITVDLRVTHHTRFIFQVRGRFQLDIPPRLVATSSGDDRLDVSDPNGPDRWVVVDDDLDEDPFLVTNLPAVVHLFEGAGAFTRVGAATFELDFANRFGRLTMQWNRITIPPGTTVAFLHFVVQQTSRAAAQASAERLAQLPPEVLAGLSLEELSQIRNFAMPAEGISPLRPLPALNGAVNGRVFLGDGTTPVPDASVRHQSLHPLFGRTFFLVSDAAGAFRLNSVFNVSGGSTAIPIHPFRLKATHPQTGVQSPDVVGNFPAGLLLATQDVLLSETGIVAGTVRRSHGVVVSSGSVSLSGGGLVRPLETAIARNGAYRFTGIPTGQYTLVATLPHPQGTPLTGATSTEVSPGVTSAADITIAPTGEVTGTLRRESVEVVVNLPVQLRAANLARSTGTDTGGRFTFVDVPTGAVTLETYDRATNTAATAQVTVVAEQTVTQDLTLVLGGTVVGLVTDPNNQPVPNARVVLIAGDRTQTATTGTDGRYRFERVVPGNIVVQATDPANGFRGRTTGGLGLSGQMLTLNMRLSASGTVTGIVFHVDRITPVVGARVSIDQFLGDLPTTVVTNGQGRYTFDFVPLGPLTLRVTDPSTGDRGIATGRLSVSSEILPVNVTLNGLGTVIVTVRDASGNLVPNAVVRLVSQTPFGVGLSGTAGADGIKVFERVLAGNFSVSATDPLSLLGGSTTGTVGVGATVRITVQLEPSGMVLGRVLAPDGATPVAEVRIRLSSFNVVRQATSAIDGSFRFEAVRLGTYTLEVFDSAGRLRAREGGLQLSSNGDLLVRNLTMIGLGMVRGLVLNPNRTPAPNIRISLQSANPVIGRYLETTSNAQGRFQFEAVPVGRVTLTARDPARGLLGEAVGQIDQDGQEVIVDVSLLANPINLPVNRFDANNFLFDIQRSGSLDRGSRDVFGGDFGAHRGALLLEVLVGGVPVRFTGLTLGAVEDNGREVVIRQPNLAGLDVTRKIFVPREGYFARYLELLTNPSSNPITVDVRLLTHLLANVSSRVIATSSGDALLERGDAMNPDRWVVLDDGDRTVYDENGNLVETDRIPPIAFGFDGPQGSQRVGTLDFARPSYGQLLYQWNQVTIPPQATVAFLHFAVQQLSREAAAASVERLIQLSPEVLAGLSRDELMQIQNFAIPLDGVSQLASLPRLDGTVTGRVLAGDGITPIPFATVSFRSHQILFGRTHLLQSDANGLFSVTSILNDVGTSRAIPIDAFTLQARHPLTGVQAPEAIGNFPADQTTAMQDILFTNTGVVRGTVRRHTGAAVTGGRVLFFRFRGIPVAIGSDGTYLMTGLPEGEEEFQAEVPHPQGTALTGTRFVVVTAGHTSVADVTIEPTGHITGVVLNATGNPAANVAVRTVQEDAYGRPRFLYATATDPSGRYTFSDISLGTYGLAAIEPTTGARSEAQVRVLQDQTTRQDLTLVGVGTLQVQVNFPTGNPVSNAGIDLQAEAIGTNFRQVGRTDASGRLTVPVPVGAFTVRASHPNNNLIVRDVTSDLVNHGDTVAVTIVLPVTGTITGQVRYARGAPAANTFVSVFDSETGEIGRDFGSNRTDAQGRYTIPYVPVGIPLTVRAGHPRAFSEFRLFTDLAVTIPEEGATITVDLILPALASLRVTVLLAENTPFEGARVDLQHSRRDRFDFVGRTNENGVLTIQDIPEGPFTVRVNDPRAELTGRVSGTITPADDGQVVEVTLIAHLPAPVIQAVIPRVVETNVQTPITIRGNRFLPPSQVQLDEIVLTDVTFVDRQTLRATVPADIPPGIYDVTVIRPDGERGTLVAGLVVIERAELTGAVRDATGAPVPKLQVIAYDPLTGFVAAGYTDEAGRYRLNPSRGTFTLLVENDLDAHPQLPEGTLVRREGVQVGPGAVQDLNLPFFPTLSGVVRDERGMPVLNAFVRIGRFDVEEEFDFGRDDEVFGWDTTDSNGSYRMRGRPGIYDLQVFPPDALRDELLSADRRQVDVTTDRVVDLVLPTALKLTGTIVDADGKPAELVRVVASDPVTGVEVFDRTYQAGRYDMRLPAGTYTVVVFGKSPGPFERRNPRIPEAGELVRLEGLSVRSDTIQNITLPVFSILSGVVRDSQGISLQGVTVSICRGTHQGICDELADEAFSGQVFTDEAGAFRLFLVPGIYDVVADAERDRGVVPTRVEDLEVMRDRTLEMVLPAGFFLTGIVVDADGQPVEDADVVALDPTTGILRLDDTDAAGRYRMRLPVGTYTVSVYLEAFVNAVLGKLFAGEPIIRLEGVSVTADTVQEIRLPALLRLSGFVRDPKGAPVVGASVQARRLSEIFGFDSTKETQTDDMGAYSLSLIPGTYEVQIDPPSTRQDLLRRELEEVEVRMDRSMDVLLPTAIRLTGAVVDAMGVPAEGLALLVEDPSGRLGGYGRTDPSGHFRLESLAAGTYTMTVSNNDFSDHPSLPRGQLIRLEGIPLRDGMHLDFTLPAFPVLSGIVQSQQGVPEPYVYLSACRQNRFGYFQSIQCQWGKTDDVGAYRLQVLPGSYGVQAYPRFESRSLFTRVEGVEVVTDRTLSIQLREGFELSGTVRDANGSPVRGLGVEADDPLTGAGYSASTDREGHYRLKLPTGTYTLSIDTRFRNVSSLPTGLELFRLEGLVVAADTRQDITLPQFPILSVAVRDPFGRPVAGVYVSVCRVDPFGDCIDFVGRVRTDETGSYRFPLVSGRYNIQVYPPRNQGMLSTTIEDLEVAVDRTLEIVLPAGLTLSGTVRDAMGTPVQQVEVVVFDPLTDDFPVSDETDEEGRYSITLPTGTYTLFVRNYRNPLFPLRGFFGPALFHQAGLVIGSNTLQDVILPTFPTLSGVVRDPQGAAVAGVTIRACPLDVFDQCFQFGDSVLTDAAGTFRLPLLPGTYDIFADPPSGSRLNRVTIEEVEIVADQALEIVLPTQ